MVSPTLVWSQGQTCLGLDVRHSMNFCLRSGFTSGTRSTVAVKVNFILPHGIYGCKETGEEPSRNQ